MTDQTSQDANVVLGEDWVGPRVKIDQEVTDRRARRGIVALYSSPIARKIILFNLMALVLLVVGVLFLNPFRDSLVLQRENSLIAETQLVADVFEGQLPKVGPVNFLTGDGVDPDGALEVLSLPLGVNVFVFDAGENLIGSTVGMEKSGPDFGLRPEGRQTRITDFLTGIWTWSSRALGAAPPEPAPVDPRVESRLLLPDALAGETVSKTVISGSENTVFIVASPIMQGDKVVGAVALATEDGAIDQLVRSEREQVLQMFILAMAVSIGLSLVLASTIANPLSDLAVAAELGRDRNARKMSPTRVRIPDLTARPDEIGRLSGALRGMVLALYSRIDANEQFAADVAHEIKNPLASLRSAIGTLRLMKDEAKREKLFDVIDHDVQRLDRLVSDISNASRLDSELVKDEETSFDLIKMLSHILQFQGAEAEEKGVDFIGDLPDEPIMIDGLEGRLAQVFVNLISNALSFCTDGDAIRVWVRKRENRVLIVVEDTGPGIPEEALSKVFNRFYSERPDQQFGEHSGLGLAISKQIIDAHGGVIWAENIRPTDADLTSEPLGARFVVGLPV